MKCFSFMLEMMIHFHEMRRELTFSPPPPLSCRIGEHRAHRSVASRPEQWVQRNFYISVRLFADGDKRVCVFSDAFRYTCDICGKKYKYYSCFQEHRELHAVDGELIFISFLLFISIFFFLHMLATQNFPSIFFVVA